MGDAAAKPRMSAEDFLAWDAHESVKHEFVGGEVFAMADADERHVTTAGNVYAALRAHLRGTPCRTFITDMKLRVEAVDAFFYPDVMVTCSAADAADPLVKREPALVVEVLSASTAAFDRGDKFAAYRTLPTLREYLLADPATRRCDLYRKGDDGLWVLHPSAPDEPVVLASVGLTLGADPLWAEVEPPAAR
ncbi:MAG: Uma2 family endonuclease [Burkholderiaceae bacterium]|jgi:Uma2 family endonuclease|nr:Uma2 family endonuclease [Burkholderiaceae bacterium]